MNDSWDRERLARLATFVGRDYARWLRTGLRDWEWEGGANRRRAFYPVNDAFDPWDDPEPQLAEMFDRLSGEAQGAFLDGMETLFHDVEPSPPGLALFDALQRILELTRRTEPAGAMVDRLVSHGFLDHLPPGNADDLYAGAFLVLRRTAHRRDLCRLVARLVDRSGFFRPDYVPEVLGMLLDREPSGLATYIDLFEPFSALDRGRAVAAARARAVSWSASDLLDVLEASDFGERIRAEVPEVVEPFTSFAREVLADHPVIREWTGGGRRGSPGMVARVVEERLADLPVEVRLFVNGLRRLDFATEGSGNPPEFAVTIGLTAVIVARQRGPGVLGPAR